MSDYIEDLWTQFAVEAQEHLDLIEPLLVEAETNALERDGIDQLFRSFHSIKGLAKAMDLLGMEAIAHHTEDILGLVRDQVIELENALADLMLRAVDALKHHLEIAQSQRQDHPANPELIAELTQACKDAAGIATSTAADVPCANIEPTQSTLPLHPEQDMLVFFAELLSNKLPPLAQILTPQNLDEAENIELIESLETLTHASTTMDFVRLSECFDQLAQLHKQNGMNGSYESTIEATTGVISYLAQIADCIRLISQQTQLDCGLSEFSGALQSPLRENIEALFEQLSQQQDDLTTLLSNPDLDQNLRDQGHLQGLRQIVQRVEILLQHLNIVTAPSSGQFLLATVAHACALTDNGQLALGVVNSEPLGDLIRGAAQCYGAQRLEAGDGVSNEQAQALTDAFWNTIKAQLSGCSVDDLNSFAKLSQQIEIDPGFESSLSIEQIDLVQQWLDEDRTVYEVLINLEKSDTLNTQLVSWLSTDIHVVTNRTLTLEGEAWTQFLLLSHQSSHQLREQATVLDPQRQLLKIKACSVLTDQAGEAQTLGVQSSAGAPETSLNTTKEQNSLRINGATLDQFISQLGELVSIRSMFNHSVHAPTVVSAFHSLKQQLGDITPTSGKRQTLLQPLQVLEQQFKLFDQIDQKMHTVLGQLQENALALRVVPMETVFKRFPRIVRDIAHAQDKQVTLTISGEKVRIDKAMVEVLHEPLLHMVRNSVDHGIELPDERLAAGKPQRAQLCLEAQQQSNTVLVTIRDDGRGIDVDAVAAKALENNLASEAELARMSAQEITQFIFHPGFSTAAKVTETSGRGVGMDVVRTNVNRLGGSITVSSSIGQGTTFCLELPLTTAIQDTLLVQTCDQMMAIPERYVTQMIEIKRHELQSVKGCQAIVLRDSFLPVYPLGQLLGYQECPNSEACASEDLVVTVLSDGKQTMGLVVDRSYRRQELFIKDIHEQLIALPGISGASVLGDGSVVLILDVEDIFKLAIKHGGNTHIANTSQSHTGAIRRHVA